MNHKFKISRLARGRGRYEWQWIGSSRDRKQPVHFSLNIKIVSHHSTEHKLLRRSIFIYSKIFTDHLQCARYIKITGSTSVTKIANLPIVTYILVGKQRLIKSLKKIISGWMVMSAFGNNESGTVGRAEDE